MRMLFIAPLLVFIVMLTILLAKLLDNNSAPPSALVGKKLPEFNLPATYMATAGLNSADIAGHYSLLNIFASWCIACKIEHEFLTRLKENRIIPIYGIAWRDAPEKLAKYLQQNGNPYEKIGADMAGKTIIDLGVTGAPETFLVAPDGTILLRYAGPLSPAIWQEKFLPLISEGQK